MAGQPFFNRMPLALGVICATMIAVFLWTLTLSPEALDATVLRFGIVPARWEDALVERDYLLILTSMIGHVFIHGGWFHLIFNTVLLVSAGRALATRLEQAPGANVRFVIVFFGSAAFAALAFVLIERDSHDPAIGASGAACGIFSAYLMAVHPDWRDSLRDRTVLLNGAGFLIVNVGLAYLASAFSILPIAWQAHLGGFIGGMVIYPLIGPKPRALAL